LSQIDGKLEKPCSRTLTSAVPLAEIVDEWGKVLRAQ
jgi:hypothetical protein